ncbi:hypothetical protein B0O99DRAFT_687537 [Bisporella sp. PMI_857]|nr:hypothetical protein B0O99DRAFT_687537 [Bisporella sp. PMI_857]
MKVIAPGAGELPPLFAITENDHGGYVCVVVYTLLILMILLVATRVFTRWYVVKFIRADDVFLMAAACLAFVQSVFVQLAVNNGLGKKRSIVSDSDFDVFQKYQYAAQVLLMATMTSAKISLSLLIQSLLSEGRSVLVGTGLLVIIICWGIASTFAVAFGCALPEPWDTTGRCVNLPVLRDAIAAFNIITDAALIVLPCILFWNVHDRMRRSRVVALFSSRIIVCIVTGLQLRYFTRYMRSPDPTWTSMDSSILDQFMMNLSIICTAIPSLGRLIVELQPEVNAFAITERHGLRSSDKYAVSSFGHRFPAEYIRGNRLGVRTSIHGRTRYPSDAESTIGLREDGLKQNANTIKQTVGYEVRYLAAATT